jgi:hypothetical protein
MTDIAGSQVHSAGLPTAGIETEIVKTGRFMKGRALAGVIGGTLLVFWVRLSSVRVDALLASFHRVYCNRSDRSRSGKFSRQIRT